MENLALLGMFIAMISGMYIFYVKGCDTEIKLRKHTEKLLLVSLPLLAIAAAISMYTGIYSWYWAWAIATGVFAHIAVTHTILLWELFFKAIEDS